MSSTDYKFEGWGAFGADSVEGNFKKFEYEPKPFNEETDVDIKIMYCGVCGSDVHTASSGWGATDYPQVVGHEIVGKAIRVGSKVTHVKVGDTVGVGAQCDSCLECHECDKQRENRCPEMVGTYGGKFKKGDSKGAKSYGGYANFNRSPGHFVVKIPDGLDPALAAPMLCGGVTVYNPLVTNGAGPGKKIGIVGLGGLGAFGVLFAKALGAEVTVISHSERKKDDATKLGASHFIATHGDDKAFAPHARSLDLIISTTNDDNMPINQYISLLKPEGRMIIVGAPEKPLPPISPFVLIMNNVNLGGSIIGSPSQINDMLELAAKQQIHPWIEKRSLNDVNKVIPAFCKDGARYRYVLVNEENGGQL